jgi:hypothetical protein
MLEPTKFKSKHDTKIKQEPEFVFMLKDDKLFIVSVPLVVMLILLTLALLEASEI